MHIAGLLRVERVCSLYFKYTGVIGDQTNTQELNTADFTISVGRHLYRSSQTRTNVQTRHTSKVIRLTALLEWSVLPSRKVLYRTTISARWRKLAALLWCLTVSSCTVGLQREN